MRVVQLLTQASGGPVDHAVDVAVTLGARGHDSHVVGPESAGTARARAAGVQWHVDEMTDKRDVAGAARVVRRLAGLRPDVLHLQDRRAGWLGRALLPRPSGVGCVYTLHGVPDGLADLVAGNVRAADRRRRDPWLYLRGERAVAAWSGSEVVVPSAAVARYALEHVGLPGRRVHVVANGVDPARFPPSTRAGARPGEPVLVWVGLLVEVKRVEALLRAVARVPAARVLVAGDGPRRAAAERLVVELGLGERVTLLGRVDDVPALLATADAYVLTSAAENCPLSLLQAMASALPVVATAVGGVPEVVRDGVDGWLVPADSDDALVAALSALVADPERARARGRSARDRIERHYTLDACVDGLERVYATARR